MATKDVFGSYEDTINLGRQRILGLSTAPYHLPGRDRWRIVARAKQCQLPVGEVAAIAALQQIRREAGDLIAAAIAAAAARP